MSAAKKDARRLKLVVPYQEPAPSSKDAGDLNSTMASMMPMAAMLTRNRLLGWLSVTFSVLGWLGESEEGRRNGSTPGYFSVAMSFMALVITYLPVFMPPPNASPATSAPAPVPLA